MAADDIQSDLPVLRKLSDRHSGLCTSLALVAKPSPSAPTPKGIERAERILEATVRCLARDGYAATSIQAVADEAGASKRMVLYYYGSREGLFAAVITRLGDRVLEALRDGVADVTSPQGAIASGFARIWDSVTEDRALLTAWIGLRVEAITDKALVERSDYIGAGIREISGTIIDRLLSLGWRMRGDRQGMEVLIVAGIEGLLLRYIEQGDSKELHAGIVEFQRVLRESVEREP